MKKLIVISVLMLAVIGAGIYENIFISSYYTRVADRLDVAAELVAAENYDSAAIIANEIVHEWEEKKTLVLLFNNHGAALNVVAQIISAHVYIEQAQKPDALAYLASAAELSREAAKNVMFFSYNIL